MKTVLCGSGGPGKKVRVNGEPEICAPSICKKHIAHAFKFPLPYHDFNRIPSRFADGTFNHSYVCAIRISAAQFDSSCDLLRSQHNSYYEVIRIANRIRVTVPLIKL